jgi:uncharacterized glyoxalase superfamily protein PhnB
MAITPYLLYRDADAAVAWLAKAFGLRRTRDVFRGSDGRINHASLTYGDAWVMLGCPGPDFKNPKILGHATQNLYVDVDDVERHYRRALRAGAVIIEQPKDTPYGARRYGAEDLEGHRWFFAAPLTAARAAPKRRSRKRKTSKRKK